MSLLPIHLASFPEPFTSHLEFNAPVRGPWNIVHMALQIPEAHLLYICARGCLRGVIMTAAEMGAMKRMSWIGVREEDLACSLDETTYTTACEVLKALEKKPPLVLVYLSCVHKFASLDYAPLLERLSRTFPSIRFIGCHMMPTMRKSGPTDEERTRAKMYEALEESAIVEERALTRIGNDWKMDENSLIMGMLREGGIRFRDLTLCRDYGDYKDLILSATLLTTTAEALFAAEELTRRIKRRHLHLPLSYHLPEIRANLSKLAAHFSLPLPDFAAAETMAKDALATARKRLKNRPISLDYTFTPRPLSLARMLIDQGFNLKIIFADAFQASEASDFSYLQQKAPDLLLSPTLEPGLRFTQRRRQLLPVLGCEVLALGQKAAFFCETDHFVNMVGGGGLYDTSGIVQLAKRMVEAADTPKDRRSVIQMKGLGLPTCLSCQEPL